MGRGPPVRSAVHRPGAVEAGRAAGRDVPPVEVASGSARGRGRAGTASRPPRRPRPTAGAVHARSKRLQAGGHAVRGRGVAFPVELCHPQRLVRPRQRGARRSARASRSVTLAMSAIATSCEEGAGQVGAFEGERVEREHVEVRGVGAGGVIAAVEPPRARLSRQHLRAGTAPGSSARRPPVRRWEPRRRRSPCRWARTALTAA